MGGGVPFQTHRHGSALHIGHLRCQCALPNKLVELKFFRIQNAAQGVWRGEVVAGGADSLVGFLRVLHLAVVLAGAGVKILLPKELLHLLAGRIQAGHRQRGGVGTHVGDVSVFVEALRDTHGAVGGEMQLIGSILLQRRRHERWVGAASVGLFFHTGNGQTLASRGAVTARSTPLQGFCQNMCSGLIQHHDILGRLPGLQLALVSKIAALGDTLPFHLHQLGGEESGGSIVASTVGDGQLGGEIPVSGGDEGHALAFPLHHHAGGDGLDTSGGEARHYLAPQDRGHFVAVEAVHDAARFLRFHKVKVEVAGVVDRFVDGLRGDLMEHHAFDRHLGFEDFQ